MLREFMTLLADTHLLNELDRVSARADQMISRIYKRLKEIVRAPPEFSLLTYLTSEREISDRLKEAKQAAERLRSPSSSEHEEQRSRDTFVVRKAMLAIELQVARLAGLLEALL